MKKTLVALAAIAASSAFAQSSVTIYGLLDVGYGTTKTTSGTGVELRKTSGLTEGVTAGNRLGFRGTEDLGGGMKASFVLESALSPTTTDMLGGTRASHSGHGDTTLAAGAAASGVGNGGAFTTAGGSSNRQSYVGLSGGFGEVRVGYHYTNLYTVSSLSGYLTGYEGMAGADTLHTYGSGNVGSARANGFTYISPKFAGGFDVHVQYGGGANPAISSDVAGAGNDYGTKRTGVLLNYANGPLKASVAYTSAKNKVAESTTTGKLTQLAARYDFGVAAVQGTYNTGENGGGTGAVTLTAADVKAYQVGVTVPFGAINVFAATGKGDTEKKDGTGVTSEIKQNTIGATYSLSKRTTLFAAHGTTKDTKVVATGAAAKGTALRLGVRHTF